MGSEIPGHRVCGGHITFSLHKRVLENAHPQFNYLYPVTNGNIYSKSCTKTCQDVYKSIEDWEDWTLTAWKTDKNVFHLMHCRKIFQQSGKKITENHASWLGYQGRTAIHPTGNNECQSAHISHHYVKQHTASPLPMHLLLTHTHKVSLNHTHAGTSLQSSPPELSPNICEAGHSQPKLAQSLE